VKIDKPIKLIRYFALFLLAFCLFIFVAGLFYEIPSHFLLAMLNAIAILGFSCTVLSIVVIIINAGRPKLVHKIRSPLINIPLALLSLAAAVGALAWLVFAEGHS
jgi:hypothetical protein